MNPVRIQRKRSKGWRMPENTIYVGRGSKWGNDARIGFLDTHLGYILTHEQAVEAFKAFMQRHPYLIDDAKKELKGKNLACWCGKDSPCHADVLLKLANEY